MIKEKFSKLLNSQYYCMLWQDEKSVDIVRQTLRAIADKLTTSTGVKAYNRTFQLNNKGLKVFCEKELSKKLFVEVFEQLTA
jgi:hypothetical protein